MKSAAKALKYQIWKTLNLSFNILYFINYILSFIQKNKKSTIQIDQGLEAQRTRFFASLVN